MTFNFRHAGDPKDLPPDTYARLRELVATLPTDQSKVDIWRDYEGPIDKICEIVGTIEVKGAVTPHLANQLAALAEKIDTLADRVETTPPFNQRVSVRIPGLGLLAMTDVKVIEDCCTDQLRDELCRGWRILAICPQPDQRRPDYILGRADPV